MLRNRLSFLLIAVAAVLALLTGAGHTAPPAKAATQNSAATPDTAAGHYTNPISQGMAVDFPDPTLMRGLDGNWYAYSTGVPIHIAKSSDLVHWQAAGSIFSGSDRPSWAAADTGFWAPDIRYVNGHYLLYFTVTDTTATTDTNDIAVGVATAPTPTGPWQDSGAALVPPRRLADGSWQAIMDPAEFTDSTGTHYLYYGSGNGGVWVQRLSADAMHTVGSPIQVTSNRYEGAYVVHHDGWYYLMVSSSSCCAGPASGYSVFVGRAKSPLGPFLDRNGVSLLASRTGGTDILAPNGNQWIGTGHNAVATDAAGQTWIVYHALDKYTAQSTDRPLMIDRLDWIDGWPAVRGGLGASDDSEVAPVTRGPVDDDFSSADRSFRTQSGSMTVEPSDPASDAGGFARLSSATAIANAKVPSDVRVEADIRNSAGLLVRDRNSWNYVRVALDSKRHAILTTVVHNGQSRTTKTALPADVDLSVWHDLAVEVRGNRLTADLTDARLGDPYATVTMTLPAGLTGGAAGMTGTGDVDNISAAALYKPHPYVAKDPGIGREMPTYSDDFQRGLSAGWTWVRSDPAAKVENGSLVWPTETGDLALGGADNTALLLRAAPKGNYVIQTKLTIDLGENTIRSYQAAGILVYVDPTNFMRLDHVASGNLRLVQFERETVAGGTWWGAGNLGSPATTTWLRIAVSVDPKTGEQHYRGGSSTDGKHWSWGNVWSLPAGSTPQIGLISQGSTPQADAQYGKATAQFDYFRVFGGN